MEGRETQGDVVGEGPTLDVVLAGQGCEEGVQSDVEEERRQRAALLEPVRHVDGDSVSLREQRGGDDVVKERGHNIECPGRDSDASEQREEICSRG